MQAKLNKNKIYNICNLKLQAQIELHAAAAVAAAPASGVGCLFHFDAAAV